MHGTHGIKIRHIKCISIFRPFPNNIWKTLMRKCTMRMWLLCCCLLCLLFMIALLRGGIVNKRQKCVNTERGCVVLEKWVQLMQIFHERIIDLLRSYSHGTCCFCDICHKYLAILGKQSRLHIGDKVRGASYSAAAAVLDWVEYNSFCQYCFGTSSL